jgi:hypothetical protein
MTVVELRKALENYAPGAQVYFERPDCLIPLLIRNTSKQGDKVILGHYSDEKEKPTHNGGFYETQCPIIR